MALWCMGLMACGSQPSQQEVKSEPSTAVLKPLVEIRNEALLRFVQQFPLKSLPYDTRSDSIAPAASPLRDAELKTFLRKGSIFEDAYQCYPMYRLPDYGNFVSLILATLGQEDNGLRLLLATYTPDGRPIDELLIKDSYSTGDEYATTDTQIAPNFALEQSLVKVTYEPTGAEEAIVEKDRSEQIRRYTINPEGKITRQL
ncbi:hypothetical protein [Rhodoflexus sp.]